MRSKTTLPIDSTERKGFPLFSGVLRYFPAALAGVARVSKLGNDKHNPGQTLFHNRDKSSDHGDCILRHLIDVQDIMAHKVVWTQEQEQQILDEVSSIAWRALAFSQEIHENFGSPLAPAAKHLPVLNRLTLSEEIDKLQKDPEVQHRMKEINDSKS